MKLSISNLAWDFPQNDEIFEELRKCGIRYVEGVLSKLGDWDSITTDDLVKLKSKLEEYNLEMISIQSIFYNQESLGLHDFDGNVDHIKRLIDFSQILGVKVMVLGSPNLRVAEDDLKNKLSDTFKKIDRLLDSTGIELLIEPNTKSYGGHYFHNLPEIVDFITSNNLNNIKTMIDTHNLILEGYNPNSEFIKFKEFIKHIHISEPGLLPLQDLEFHSQFGDLIKNMNYTDIVTYEIKPTENFFETISIFKKIYS